MKKIICFVLGLIIGASGAFYFGNSLKDADIPESISSLLNKISDSDENIYEETEKNEDYTEKNKSDEKELINITSHLNFDAVLSDDIGFPVPSADLLDPEREGEDIIYDMQENGKGVLINYYVIGMQKVLADIFVTSDNGKHWEAVQRKSFFLSGYLDVAYIGDTIIIVNSNGASTNTHIAISNDNGKTFDGGTDDENSFAKLIGEAAESRMMAFPVFLSKDAENKTVLCAWFRSDVWEFTANDLLLIAEHDAETFEMTKEFYRNKASIDDLIEWCS